MKIWVEIVAVNGKRIKNPIREDYEDHRDDDPIFAPHVVAEGFDISAPDYESDPGWITAFICAM